MKSLAILALLASTAVADDEVIATQPLAFAARGFSLSYEHALPDERFSALVLGGYRDAAGGDFDANTFTIGGELRWWMRSRTPMRGPFLAIHASAGHTRVSEREMHIGSTSSLTQRLDVGWRWVIRDRVTLSPALGLAIHEDVSAGGLTPNAHGMIGIGFEVGWMLHR
jgi:hypothetical protein